MSEYVGRCLELKSTGKTFAIRRTRHQLNDTQRKKLKQIADFLAEEVGPESGNFNDLFDFADSLEAAIENRSRQSEKDKKGKKGKKDKSGKGDAIVDILPSEEESKSGVSEDEESDEEANKVDYIDIVKKALIDTRRVLENLDENGALYT